MSSQVPPSDIDARLAAALPIVAAAGQLALRYFRMPISVENKRGDGAFDPVTEADRGVEALIRARLGAVWPDSPIVGEEEGFTPGTSAWSWIIDPIDGTRAFITGVPAWGILLGLLYDGLPVGGIVHQPYLDETFVGAPSGAILRGRGAEHRLQTSGRTTLSEAVLYSTHPSMFVDEAKAGFDAVSGAVRMTRFGGDCYSYCLLAHGFIDLVIESGLQPYDILPLVPIIEAAGGAITTLTGEVPLAGGTVIAAATPALHARALDTFLTARR
jgi:histidinol phosphatase-like enzyme (inositol monophosphatase family)